MDPTAFCPVPSGALGLDLECRLLDRPRLADSILPFSAPGPRGKTEPAGRAPGRQAHHDFVLFKSIPWHFPSPGRPPHLCTPLSSGKKLFVSCAVGSASRENLPMQTAGAECENGRGIILITYRHHESFPSLAKRWMDGPDVRRFLAGAPRASGVFSLCKTPPPGAFGISG